MSLVRFLIILTQYLGKIVGPLLLLGLRAFFGYQFYVAGLGKLQAIDTTVTFFEQLNIMYPMFNAYLVGVVEMVGGLALIAGFAARLMALPLSITMIVAYATAHFPAVQAFMENPQGIIDQEPFMYLVTSLAVLAFGPGAISIDAIIKSVARDNRGAPSVSDE